MRSDYGRIFFSFLFFLVTSRIGVEIFQEGGENNQDRENENMRHGTQVEGKKDVRERILGEKEGIGDKESFSIPMESMAYRS